MTDCEADNSGLKIVKLITKGDKMTTGTVKWFNSRKGYGFIQPENGGKDVFVHITKLEEKGLRKLYEGQRVSYEIYDDRGRTAAGEIEIL